jgi:hypothetical protein
MVHLCMEWIRPAMFLFQFLEFGECGCDFWVCDLPQAWEQGLFLISRVISGRHG